MERSNTLILDIQWLRGNANQVFVKELAFTTADSMNFSFYHFLPPFSSNELLPIVRRSNNYCSKRINGLKWDEGCIPYTALPCILRPLSKYDKILVHGEEKIKFLKQYLNNVEAVPNMTSFFKIPAYKHSCILHHECFKRCALHHIFQIMFYCEREGIYTNGLEEN